MSNNKQNFNQSIKYFMPLIDNLSFKNSVYFLISRLINKKDVRKTRFSRSNKPVGTYFTILRPGYTCKKNYAKSKTSTTDFHLHNLDLNIPITMSRSFTTKYGKEIEYFFGTAFWFNNKESCYSFLKQLKISKDEVIFSAYIAKFNMYEVVLRFSNSLTPKQSQNIINIANTIFDRCKNSYKNSIATNYCYIPSSIYDRWFDPFSKTTIWDSKIITKTFRNSTNFQKIVKNLLIWKCQLQYNFISKDSRINYFISNKNRLSPEKIRQNLFIVNHYLKDKNPYKRKDARKDWKFAAEAYLNEVIGKLKYNFDMYNYELVHARDYMIEHPNSIMSIRLNYINNCKERIKLASYDKNVNVKLEEENIQIYTKAYNKYLDEAVIERKNLLKSNLKERFTLFFSKKETENFVKSLNLKTKISAVKLRKIVLDKLCELGIFRVEREYRSKVFCRLYFVLKDKFLEFYSKISSNLKYFIFYYKFIYMLQNKFSAFSDKVISISLPKGISRYILSPPG